MRGRGNLGWKSWIRIRSIRRKVTEIDQSGHSTHIDRVFSLIIMTTDFKCRFYGILASLPSNNCININACVVPFHEPVQSML